jgi:ribonucleoside-diphosphate reductase alpha chain
LKKIFVTALDIRPEDHIKALAAFQKWVDSSISKTNNFPADATVEQMKKTYLLAYKLGCKDVTVYRDSSIKGQVLVALQDKKKEEKTSIQPNIETKSKNVSYRQLTNCPECNTMLSHAEGCVSCLECGWGVCT